MTSPAPRPRRSDALRQRLRPRPALRLQRSLPTASQPSALPAVGPSLQAWEVRGPNAVRSALLAVELRGQLLVHAVGLRPAEPAAVSPARFAAPRRDRPSDRGALLLAEVMPGPGAGAPSLRLAPGQRSLAARWVAGARAPRFVLRQRCRARLAQLTPSTSATPATLATPSTPTSAAAPGV